MSIIQNPKISIAKCVAISDRDILLRKDENPISFADLQQLKSIDANADLFEEPEFGICVLSLSSNLNIPDDYKFVTLRQFNAEHSEDETFYAFRAKALSEWRNKNKFCSCCGAEMNYHQMLTARVCPSCKHLIFPRIDPCIIVLVNKGDKILLARHVQRNQDIYACIAGFMEAGESVEHAVAREIFEETGLKVKNIVYRGSQSWPFPQQLMLGFTAEYESGEIKLQPEEIADAQWFDRDNCPASPRPGSIAYKLIHNKF